MNFTLKLFTELSPEQLSTVEQSYIVNRSRKHWKYSRESIAYYREYFGKEYQDKSFVIFVGKQVAAHSFIYKKAEASFFNMPVEVFIEASLASKKLASIIVKYLLDISRGTWFKIYYNKYLAYTLKGQSGHSLSFGHECYYRVVLHQTIDEIKSNFRKSYKSLVNWCLKNIQYYIVDKKNFDENAFWQLKDFHVETSGRMTRSMKSWELQLDMIRVGRAFLINGYLEEEKLVSSAFYMLGDESNYAVAVYDREMMAQNIGLAHGSQYQAIDYLMQQGGTSLTLGHWDVDAEISQKEEQILEFKRGFTNALDLRPLLIVRNEV